MSSTIPPGHHLAAIIPSKGPPLAVTHRPTPTPSPTELLIAVKAIALNPIDWYQRDHAFPPLASYPAVLGSDISGTVISAGSSVPADAPQPGTRVAAYAPCFFMQGAPDYGALQTRVLVPAVNAVEIPRGLGFAEASVLPMAVATAWAGWYSIGLARETKLGAEDRKGVLVWGGANSVGSAAVQVAKCIGFRVYVTASEKHHEYLKGLGASRVFDYKSEDCEGSEAGWGGGPGGV
jgi:NADPH:quinone reductase-like Zn-dependent oxidoreductase